MKRYGLLFVILALLLTACQQELKATPTPPLASLRSATPTNTVTQTATETVTPLPSATFTEMPTPTKTPRPTGTITPTPTPTAPIIEVGGNPVRQGTRLPEVETITLDNIDRLEEIGRWGYGSFQEVIFSEDESEILALTSSGIVVFSAKTMREARLVNMDLRDCDFPLQFSPSGNYVMCFLNEPRKYDYVDPRIVGLDLISVNDGSLYKSIQIDQARHAWLAPDDQRLFIADRNVQIWDILEEKWMEDVTYSNFPAMRFIGDGSSFVVYDPVGGPAYIFKEDEELRELPSSGTYYSYNAPYPPISSDGKYVAGDWADSGNLFVKDVQSGDIL
ncbi:MAG: hypothetical protein V2J07_06995, partial [Anaerolineae bacterium]|nr:hypothetical protein [Anaerolineae bacterium]